MKQHGIERQTLTVAIVPVLVLAMILEGFFTYTRFSDLDRALFERGRLIVRQLASSSEYPVFSGNHALLQQQVDIAFAQQDVNSIIVLDRDKNFLAGAGVAQGEFSRESFDGQLPPKGRDIAALRENRVALWLYQPIVATQIELDDLSLGSADAGGSRPLGGVILEIGKGRVNQEKIEMLGFNLLLLLAVLLSTIMIALRMSRRITQPVMEMKNAIRRIGEGRLDTRIGESRVLELDVLASGINDMAEQLLQDRNMLQQRIDDATLELRRKKEEAEKANFDKSRFLAAASHDLRQPMHALGLFVGELHSRLETQDQRKIAAKVEESVEAMSSLLDALLDISKLDAGVVVPQVREVHLDAMVRRLAHDFTPLAERKNVTLRFRCHNAMALSDPLLLERILLNLLGNAIRYTPVNGMVLLACRRRGDNLLIEVRDNGPGIPAEEQQNIFREFVQLNNSARDRSKGLGLGLAIVDRLARLLHHPLSLRSSPGRGSVFAIAVPRIFGLDDLLAEPDLVPAIPPARHDRLENLRVLVVDDDMLVRTSTAGILESWGCHVSIAESLQDAAEKIRSASFDMVICDFRLPDGDGLELDDRIRDHCSIQPAFILVSGDTSPEVLQTVNERGHHLLHKPVRPAKLRSLMLFLLKQRGGEG